MNYIKPRTEKYAILSQVAREKIFDDEYDSVKEKLETIKKFCKQNNSSLFEETFTMSLMKFLNPPLIKKSKKKEKEEDTIQ